MTTDEAKRREVLGDAIQADGSLHRLTEYINWHPEWDEATLDGSFTADELEAIAAHMRAHGAK